MVILSLMLSFFLNEQIIETQNVFWKIDQPTPFLSFDKSHKTDSFLSDISFGKISVVQTQ